MEDRYGHRIRYLRLSITDRCNERCRYCMPDETQEWLPRDEILSYEEIHRVAAVGAGLGVKKIRVTGGEPLTRRDVLPFLSKLNTIPGIEQLGISTNGTLLADPAPDDLGGKEGKTVADALAAAGVKSVNVSLDSLDPDRYAVITGRRFLDRALAGIDAALAAGIPSVRINAVLTKGQSEGELVPLVDYCGERGLLLRFIELMPVSTRDVLDEENFLAGSLAREIIGLKHGELKLRPDFRTGGPSRYYEVPGREGQLVGFISAMSDLHFCESCDKLRLTSDGKLRPCLGSHLEFDLKSVLRDPAADDDALRAAIRNVVDKKPEQHDFRNAYEPGRRMIAIGG